MLSFQKPPLDEVIFKTDNPRNRLILELMARGGMRVGELLKLRAKDVNERRLHLVSPKSGRQSEVVFIPQRRYWGQVESAGKSRQRVGGESPPHGNG